MIERISLKCLPSFFELSPLICLTPSFFYQVLVNAQALCSANQELCLFSNVVANGSLQFKFQVKQSVKGWAGVGLGNDMGNSNAFYWVRRILYFFGSNQSFFSSLLSSPLSPLSQFSWFGKMWMAAWQFRSASLMEIVLNRNMSAQLQRSSSHPLPILTPGLLHLLLIFPRVQIWTPHHLNTCGVGLQQILDHVNKNYTFALDSIFQFLLCTSLLASPSARLVVHNDRGVVTANLAASSSSFTIPAANSSNGNNNGNSNDGVITKVNSTALPASGSTTAQYNQYINLHLGFMIGAWILCAPIGIFIARFLKVWSRIGVRRLSPNFS